MVFEISTVVIQLIISGLALLLYDMFLVKHVSVINNRFYFYLILILQLLAYLKFSHLSNYNISGGLTYIDLNSINGDARVVEIGNWSFYDLLMLIYVLGFLVGFTKLSLGLLRIQKLIRKSAMGRNKYERLIDSPIHPCTFFKYVLIPTNLPMEVHETVYTHEKYHADQWHSADMFLWHLWSIVFWFNPFVHLLKSRQTQNLEYATDAHMILKISKEKYTEHLLHSTFELYKTNFNPMFNKSKIYLRMKKLNENRQRKGIRSWFTLGITVFFLLSAMVLTKASLVTTPDTEGIYQMSKPEFLPDGHGPYIASKIQEEIGERFSDIARDYEYYLYLDITIDEKGQVISVEENKAKTRSSNDPQTDAFARNLLVKTIKNMPKWVPAQQNGVAVESTIQEEFHFSGAPEN